MFIKSHSILYELHQLKLLAKFSFKNFQNFLQVLTSTMVVAFEKARFNALCIEKCPGREMFFESD